MQNDFSSYLDDFNKITILIDKKLCCGSKQFFLNYCDERINLNVYQVADLGEKLKFEALLTFDLDLHQECILVDEFDNVSYTTSGKIVRTPLFEEKYSYDGPLGVEYTAKSSIFRLWTPVAKEVQLVLLSNANVSTAIDMHYINRGLWETNVLGDFEGYRYYYRVRLSTVFDVVNDPYAISSSSNGMYNFIINPKKLDSFKFTRPSFSGVPTDAVIYEANVRDFSSSSSAKAIHKGKFLGMLENHPTDSGYPTGVSYIGYLGVTHVQLMPVFDFGGVDDNSDTEYNWGYNPEQYFIPCGWYSDNPDHPYARLNEFIHLVDGMHANNLRVVTDFVFNHVYDMFSFPFEKLVPGYFYRVDSRDMYTETSGCQNDIETRRFMARRFIVDVIKYWTLTFHISGVRFDLMGLLDINTMRLIEREIHAIDPSFLLYGEGWQMPSSIPDEEKPHMYNGHLIPDYGFFNDSFRDFFKGNQWDHSVGYSAGSKNDLDDLFYLVTGSVIDNYIFDKPSQTVNFVECHDNYTFVDFLRANGTYSDEEIKDSARLALCIVIISAGIPFIHAGQEFFRSKQMVENSYNSGDSINAIDYDNRDKYFSNITTIRDIIKVRRDYSELRCNSRSLITNRATMASKAPVIIKYSSLRYNLLLIIKNDYETEPMTFANAILVFDGFRYCNDIVSDLTLTKPGVYIVKENKNE